MMIRVTQTPARTYATIELSRAGRTRASGGEPTGWVTADVDDLDAFTAATDWNAFNATPPAMAVDTVDTIPGWTRMFNQYTTSGRQLTSPALTGSALRLARNGHVFPGNGSGAIPDTVSDH